MKSTITREAAWELLKEYNQESFHRQHALTVEAVMGWFAEEEGYGEEKEFWSIVGLLHDVDFERYPEEHCKKAVEILESHGVSPEMIHAVCSHGYGLVSDVQPEHTMEKILFATDELTGLIGAAALMRPSKSVEDMELKSLKKKFKDKRFAGRLFSGSDCLGGSNAGMGARYVIRKNVGAMKASEKKIQEAMNTIS